MIKGFLGGILFGGLFWLAFNLMWAISYQLPTFNTIDTWPYFLVVGSIVGIIISKFDK